MMAPFEALALVPEELATVRPMIETMPLERAAEACERLMSGAARFRMVLTIGG